ncbi:diaminopimelate epimerase [candidate division WOR-3 bacterium]|nr:diaminopimelate epimerase [candidate division WOR-3 bacterium]
MIEFVKGVGGGNDFILISHKDRYNYSEIACRFLKRRFGVGGDGLIVMDDNRMRFFNPDGTEVSFCGNGVRVFFYLRYLQGKVKETGRVMTGAGPVNLKYEGNRMISIEMPEIDIKEKTEEGTIVYCGVPHLIIACDDVNNIDVESDGKRLSAILNNGSNVDWVSCKGDTLYIRTYERGVFTETLSCGSGIASASFLFMKQTGKGRFDIIAKGGDFITELNSQDKIILKGEVDITFKGSILEEEDKWLKEGFF